MANKKSKPIARTNQSPKVAKRSAAQGPVKAHKQQDLSPEQLRRLGEAYLAELADRDNLVEELHPDGVRLRQWLAKDRIGGKFVPWWHQAIDEAKRFHIPVSPAWDVIAASLDVLFPETSNTFNMASVRPCADEAGILAHLKREHGIGADQARALTIVVLAELLQADASEQSGRTVPTGPNDERNRFAYREHVRGKTLKEIWVGEKQHPEWEQVNDLRHVRGHIKAHCLKRGLRIPTRRPRGRPKRGQ